MFTYRKDISIFMIMFPTFIVYKRQSPYFIFNAAIKFKEI